MNVVQAIIDVRKLKRMTALIEQNDADKAAHQLQEVLQEALAIQMTGNVRAQANAIQELKSLRNAMMTGSIQAGARQARLIGAFTLASEEMERENLKLMQKANKDRAADLSFISDSLPSMDSLTSALITANPFVGYSVKILRDISRSAKQRRAAAQDKKLSRLELIQQQQSRIADVLQGLNDPPESSEPEEKKKKEKDDADFGPDLQPVIDVMDNGWNELFTPYADKTTRLLEDIENNTFALAKAWDASHERIVRINEEQINEEERLKRVADEEERARLERERENANGGPAPDTSGPGPTPEEQNGGLAGIFGGLLGSLTGGGLMAAMGAIGALFTGVMGIGAFAGKILAKGSWLAAIVAIYDLIDGFFTAKDIFGKQNVTIRERIEAGIANMLGNLGAMFDEVFNWFGLDIIKMSKDELVKGEAAMIHDLTQVFVDLWDGVVDFFIGIKDEILKFFSDPTTYMEEFMRKFVENSSIIQGARKGIQGLQGVLEFPTEEEQQQGRLEASTLTERLARGQVGQVPSLSNYPLNNITQEQVNSRREEIGRQQQQQTVVVSAPSSTVNNTHSVSGGGSPRNNDPSFRGVLNRNFGN